MRMYWMLFSLSCRHINHETRSYCVNGFSLKGIMQTQIIFLILSAVWICTTATSIEAISDDDLVERIKTSDFFVVLFCKCILPA